MKRKSKRQSSLIVERRHLPADLVRVTVTVPDRKAMMLETYAKRLLKRRPARRDEVLSELRRHEAELRTRYGVKSLSLFGSVARNEATRQSDVDLLVEYENGHPTGLFEFVTLKSLLSSLVKRPVDLITPTNIKPRLRARILKEAIRVL